MESKIKMECRSLIGVKYSIMVLSIQVEERIDLNPSGE
jgi:hypothetical protein